MVSLAVNILVDKETLVNYGLPFPAMSSLLVKGPKFVSTVGIRLLDIQNPDFLKVGLPHGKTKCQPLCLKVCSF